MVLLQVRLWPLEGCMRQDLHISRLGCRRLRLISGKGCPVEATGKSPPLKRPRPLYMMHMSLRQSTRYLYVVELRGVGLQLICSCRRSGRLTAASLVLEAARSPLASSKLDPLLEDTALGQSQLVRSLRVLNRLIEVGW